MAENLNASFVDLATRQAVCHRLYGGNDCLAQVGREIRPVSWMTLIQTRVKKEPQGESCGYKFARSADAINHAWLSVTTPRIRVKENLRKTHRIAFTQNLMHNVSKSLKLDFNDLTAVAGDTATLDNLAAYMEDSSKWEAYQSFIGNIPALTKFSTELPETPLQLPLNLMPWEKDTTNALLLCCLRLNEVRINAEYNLDLSKLIRVQRLASSSSDDEWEDVKAKDVNWGDLIEVQNSKNGLHLALPDCWAEYCMFTKGERKFHRSNPCDYLIEQYQRYDDKKQPAGTTRFDFKFNYPHRVLFFNSLNATAAEYNNHSNYTTNPHDAASGADPCKTVSYYYDQIARFENYPAGMFSTMIPYYHAKRVSLEPGYHMLSYSNKNGMEQDCSTNLTSVSSSFELKMSDAADDDDDENHRGSKFIVKVRGINHNIARIEGDTFGFPSYSVKDDE